MRATKASLALPALFALLLPVAPAGAGFRIEGGKADSFPAAAGVIAVLPPSCPAKVDCAWLERQVAGELLRHSKWPFRSPAQSRAALQDLGKPTFSDDDRQALAERLGAQTLLEIHVVELVKERPGRTLDPDDPTSSASDARPRVRGRLEIRAFAAETGKTVAEGAAFGDDQGAGEKRFLGAMLRQLLDRMFPPR